MGEKYRLGEEVEVGAVRKGSVRKIVMEKEYVRGGVYRKRGVRKKGCKSMWYVTKEEFKGKMGEGVG